MSPIDVGIVPTSLLVYEYKYINLLIFPISDGMLPLNLFTHSAK
jgi:hypothetical protein